jgi:outer membrane immunogenic protein
MKGVARFAGTAGAVWLLAGSALAGGLPGASKGGAGGSDCPAARFQGFYVGAHAGFTSMTSHQTDLDGYLETASWAASDSTGITGLQVGYNVTRCHTLVGIEADWSWGSLDADTRMFPNFSDFGAQMTTSISGFGTLRARAGMALDNLLLYATGGLAMTKTNTRISQFSSDYEFRYEETFSFSDNRIGWTAGVGAEWALTKNISLKSEVLYANFGDNNNKGQAFIFSSGEQSFKTDDSIWTGRLGLNVKLGN